MAQIRRVVRQSKFFRSVVCARCRFPTATQMWGQGGIRRDRLSRRQRCRHRQYLRRQKRIWTCGPSSVGVISPTVPFHAAYDISIPPTVIDSTNEEGENEVVVIPSSTQSYGTCAPTFIDITTTESETEVDT